MNRWITHAIGWLAIAIGGTGLYVAMEEDPLKGLALATGTILIDIGILFIHEDIKKAKWERMNREPQEGD